MCVLQILTTHDMEEADHLCTRVGIMNHGKLRCLGSQNRLKAKYGRGYQLQFDAAHGRVRGGWGVWAWVVGVQHSLLLTAGLEVGGGCGHGWWVCITHCCSRPG